MKVIGLTGGIGSGKTTVTRMFSELGVPIYIADEEAKNLMNTSEVIRKKLIELLGEKSYKDEILNRKYVADLIFNDEKLLASVNAIVHPEVALHFEAWLKKQNSAYVIKEAAILFENGSYKNFDKVILVTAPKAIRIDRVMKRDNVSKSKVEERIKNQWSDARKKKLANIIIKNIDLKTTHRIVKTLHKSLS